MAVTKHLQRTVVELDWDPTKAVGSHVSIIVDGEEKRSEVPNKPPGGNITFPYGFTGDSEVLVRGSSHGEDGPAIIHVD